MNNNKVKIFLTEIPKVSATYEIGGELLLRAEVSEVKIIGDKTFYNVITPAKYGKTKQTINFSDEFIKHWLSPDLITQMKKQHGWEYTPEGRVFKYCQQRNIKWFALSDKAKLKIAVIIYIEDIGGILLKDDRKNITGIEIS